MIKNVSFVIILYIKLCVLCKGSGIFNEESVITFKADDEFSEYFGYSVVLKDRCVVLIFLFIYLFKKNYIVF